MEWQHRLDQENKNWSHTVFLTLTYDDDNVPFDGVSKDHVQKFFKKLRHEVDFKYYAISEYGPHNTHRPHYHIILFQDLEFLKIDNLVTKHWRFGNITCSEIEDERIAYCASYHITKTMNPDKKNPNFVLMSKGLGLSYLTKNRVNYFRRTGNMFARHYDGYRLPLARYYKEKIGFTPSQKKENYELVSSQSLITDMTVQQYLLYESNCEKLFLKKINKKGRL